MCPNKSLGLGHTPRPAQDPGAALREEPSQAHPGREATCWGPVAWLVKQEDHARGHRCSSRGAGGAAGRQWQPRGLPLHRGSRELQVETLVAGPNVMSQSGGGVWADPAPGRVWGEFGARASCMARPQPCPCPCWGIGFLLAARPPGHIRSSVGTSWGSCSALALPPPWEPELGQAPKDGVGEGACCVWVLWGRAGHTGPGPGLELEVPPSVLGSPPPACSLQGCRVWGTEDGVWGLLWPHTVSTHLLPASGSLHVLPTDLGPQLHTPARCQEVP